MAPPDDRRALCGILFADVVGYSRLMAEDEVEAVACIGALERVFAAVVPRYGGRFHVQAGDSFLGTFDTALGAFQAAIDTQRALHETPVLFLGRDEVRIRIGVHLGDVLTSSIGMSSSDINLASRIQDKAMPGGIDVSEDVYRQVRNKIHDLPFDDLGLKEFKHIGEPRRVYRVRLPWLAGQPAFVASPQPVAPHRSRRFVLLSLATGSFAAAYLTWRGLKDTMGWTPPASPPSTSWPLTIGIMEITARGEAPEWMCDITHQGLNALLSKFDKLRVISKDMIDWKREKTGQKSFEIAKELGVTRMLSGLLIRSTVKVTLQLRVVDTATGQQIGSCESTGTDDQLVEIQNDVGLQVVTALKVPVTKAEVDRVLLARNNVDLDVTKRFADAFGGDAEPAEPDTRPRSWLPTWPRAAYGAGSDEAAVTQLLERYRTALQAKSLEQLEAIYVSLSDATRESLGRYFQSASDLTVQFSNVSFLFEGDEALATFTRSDSFKDVQTGREVTLEVRVSTVVARADGMWKIKALRKPS